MQDFRRIQAMVADLLETCPAEIPDATRESLRLNILAGEPELTFDAICEWIYELDVVLRPDYFERLEKVRSILELDSDFLDFIRGQVGE